MSPRRNSSAGPDRPSDPIATRRRLLAATASGAFAVGTGRTVADEHGSDAGDWTPYLGDRVEDFQLETLLPDEVAAEPSEYPNVTVADTAPLVLEWTGVLLGSSYERRVRGIEYDPVLDELAVDVVLAAEGLGGAGVVDAGYRLTVELDEVEPAAVRVGSYRRRYAGFEFPPAASEERPVYQFVDVENGGAPRLQGVGTVYMDSDGGGGSARATAPADPPPQVEFGPRAATVRGTLVSDSPCLEPAVRRAVVVDDRLHLVVGLEPVADAAERDCVDDSSTVDYDALVELEAGAAPIEGVTVVQRSHGLHTRAAAGSVADPSNEDADPDTYDFTVRYQGYGDPESAPNVEYDDGELVVDGVLATCDVSLETLAVESVERRRDVQGGDAVDGDGTDADAADGDPVDVLELAVADRGLETAPTYESGTGCGAVEPTSYTFELPADPDEIDRVVVRERGRNGESVTEHEPEVSSGAVFDPQEPQWIRDDGRYWDVTGDGEVSLEDVSVFQEHLFTDAVQDRPDRFDFAGGDSVSHSDVIALFQEATGL